MTAPFDTHRDAALAMLNGVRDLTRREAQFLGNVCVEEALTERQRRWLVVLLDRHGLPPLADGGEID